MQSKILALAALAAAPILAHKPVVNVYFGQTGTDSLGSYCESNSFEYVTIGFVNNSPEQDKSGLEYPGTNFAAHCAADVYTKNGKKSQLLSQCTFIADDIPKCQAAGKKVLLSVGGVFNKDSNYTVSSAAKGVKFADFLWGSFGPYDDTYPGPRPFDFNGKHVAVDGFDFDIETKFADQSGYIAMIARLRQRFALGDYLITGAPQCPLSDQFFQMKEMITKSKFDILWIQFYNNPGCDAVPNNDLTGPGEHFNYDEWETFLAGTQSKNAKLFIGILGAPADPPSPQSGYLEPEDAIVLFEEYKTRPSFGGAMIWDVNTGGQVLPDGKTYIETIHDVVCGPPEVITTTTEPAPTSTVYPTTEETYPSTTADVTTSDSYPSETETATETAYPSQPTEAYPTSTEGETSDSYPTATGTDYPSQPTDTYPTSTEDSDAYPTTTIDDSAPTDAYPSASDTEACDDDEYPTETGTEGPYPTETGTEGPYPTETEGTYPTATETSEAYPTGTETCTDETETAVPTSDVYPTGTEGSYPTGTEGSYPTGTEGSYPTGTSASEAYPASSETCTESDVYPTSAASETAPVEGYPVTKEVIATVVPAPSGYEVVTPSGVGNFEVYPTQAFSTVTVAKYPTGGVVPSASYANSAPAAAGTEYPNGNPTPTYPGYATSASAAVEVTAPVTAGAGRNAVAFGVPAAIAVAMLVL